MPGPSSSTVQRPVVEPDPDRAAGRAPLHGVVEQVGHRALEGRPPRRSPTRARCRRRSCRPVPRRRTRATARSTTSARSTCSTARAAAARRGPARPGRRPGWTSPRSGRRTSSSSSAARRPGRARRPRRPGASRSRLVRSEVSGVRSSWPASATSRRCRSREADSAASIALNAVASRAISSSPSTGSGCEVLGAGDASTAGEPAHRAQAVAGHAPAGERGADHAGEAEQQHHQRRAAPATCSWGASTGRGPGRSPCSGGGHGDHPVVAAVRRDGAARCWRCARAPRRSRARRAGSRRALGRW